MNRILSVIGLAVCGFMLVSMVDTPLTAHQKMMTDGDVGAMIHLDPDDSPYAKKPTLTWFMLMRRSGNMISGSNCDCRVAAYDSRNRAIAHHLPISLMPLEGHQKEHEVIRTMITFPKPGRYTVILTGQSKDESFAPFELKFPVTVRP